MSVLTKKGRLIKDTIELIRNSGAEFNRSVLIFVFERFSKGDLINSKRLLIASGITKDEAVKESEKLELGKKENRKAWTIFINNESNYKK